MNKHLNSVYSDIYPPGSEHWSTEERKRWRVRLKNARNKDKIMAATKRSLQDPEKRQRHREMVSARWYIRGYIPDEIVRELLFGDFVDAGERKGSDNTDSVCTLEQTVESGSRESNQ